MSIIQNQYYGDQAEVVFCEPVNAPLNNIVQTEPYYSVEEVRRKARFFAAKPKKEEKEESELTSADKIAWWGYMKEKCQANYDRATIRRYGKDENIDDICDPKTLNVNDYFEIYNLPRITAKNHEIRVNGEVVAEYRNESDYRKERDIFFQTHKDERYEDWKREQFFVCQKGLCAWCKKEVAFNKTQTDHIKPAVFFGSNDPSNLVVACAECNRMKGAVRVGWNDDMDTSKPNAKPSWIGENKRWDELRAAIAQATKEIEDSEAQA